MGCFGSQHDNCYKSCPDKYLKFVRSYYSKVLKGLNEAISVSKTEIAGYFYRNQFYNWRTNQEVYVAKKSQPRNIGYAADVLTENAAA